MLLRSWLGGFVLARCSTANTGMRPLAQLVAHAHGFHVRDGSHAVSVLRRGWRLIIQRRQQPCERVRAASCSSSSHQCLATLVHSSLLPELPGSSCNANMPLTRKIVYQAAYGWPEGSQTDALSPSCRGIILRALLNLGVQMLRWIDAGKFLTGFSAVGSIAIPAILYHADVSYPRTPPPHPSPHTLSAWPPHAWAGLLDSQHLHTDERARTSTRLFSARLQTMSAKQSTLLKNR